MYFVIPETNYVRCVNSKSPTKFIRHTAAGQFILKHFVKVHLRLKVNISDTYIA